MPGRSSSNQLLLPANTEEDNAGKKNGYLQKMASGKKERTDISFYWKSLEMFRMSHFSDRLRIQKRQVMGRIVVIDVSLFSMSALYLKDRFLWLTDWSIPNLKRNDIRQVLITYESMSVEQVFCDFSNSE
ncbi:hypothetical protein AVEN_8538-1 [Araneus ventricosus]|uniref:Uncharacterized protein n=1 Tax=Araneus ventricosus TaxID=182803 RepID=A0A4Y2FNF8_ARAVE|nr:hypothetical protein AVEN_8538-1 [Araneus ventricosus]